MILTIGLPTYRYQQQNCKNFNMAGTKLPPPKRKVETAPSAQWLCARSHKPHTMIQRKCDRLPGEHFRNQGDRSSSGPGSPGHAQADRPKLSGCRLSRAAVRLGAGGRRAAELRPPRGPRPPRSPQAASPWLHFSSSQQRAELRVLRRMARALPAPTHCSRRKRHCPGPLASLEARRAKDLLSPTW